MRAHIGVVGCSAEGAALCYRTICETGAQILGGHDHPEVSMHTHSLEAYMECINRLDWSGVAELMLSSAQKLAAAGADFLICPDNTIHGAFGYVEPRSPLPWMHIAEVVVNEARRRGFSRVGLTGTKWLVESGIYEEKVTGTGIACVRPDHVEGAEMNRIIMEELVHGIIRAQSIESFQRIIWRLRDAGCDAVILGCTEIPLIIDDVNSPLPVLDSTRLLARAAVLRALGRERG